MLEKHRPKSRPSGASAKATRSVPTPGPVLLIALASLILSVVTLGLPALPFGKMTNSTVDGAK